MHFSKLRLVGFKSFVEPTEFLIQPGLTGVVGPNGCGKSNLVEALRWVMGENSYKSMRASGMDDVIFAGGGGRPARNMAEVRLTLDNSARTAPAAFNTADVLEITRTIEREQGSTYRINGREVRARDVQILFADASTGSRSPSLVRQGQINDIVSAKPQARRRILEEAAGVAGLHTRRHEAELRLKGAEDNLARIDDVLTQIAAQGDGLRRQARQAHRYKAIQAEIRRTQALAMLIDWETARHEVAEAEAVLIAASSQVVEATREQGEASRNQAVAAHALPALRDAEVEAGAALQRVVIARETLDGEERRAKGRLAEIERRIKEMNADVARDAAAFDDAASVLARLEVEQVELAAVECTETAETALRETLARVEAACAAVDADLAKAQSERADAEARKRALEDGLRNETARLARLERDFASAHQARAHLIASLDIGDQITASVEHLRLASEAVAGADTNGRAAERGLVKAREAEQAARAPLSDADRRSQRLDTEVKTLTKLLETVANAKWPPVTEAIVVAKGYEAALGAAFGDDLDASSNIKAPAHWADVGTIADVPLPDGTRPLSDWVDAPPALSRRLAQIGLVERGRGAALRGKLTQGQRLVSREGDIWRWDGFTQAAESPTPAARRLAERNRLVDLRADMVEAQTAYATLKAAADSSQSALREAITRDAKARADHQTMRRVFEAARDAHSALERRQVEASARLATLEAQEAGAVKARDDAVARKRSLEADLANLPQTSDIVSRIEAARRQAAENRASETETRSSLQTLGREREATARRLVAIAEEQRSWIIRRDQAEGHQADLGQRLAVARQEQAELAAAPDRFVLARRQILSEIEDADTTLRAAGDAKAKAETALAEADRGARLALDAMSTAREDKARAEARREASADRLDIVVTACAADLDCAPEGLPALAWLKAAEARPSALQVATQLEALKTDRERLGAVNLRAEEELAALETQQSTLDTEKADLTEAIRRLRQAIGSLNKEGRERLLGAFAVVSGHFRELFNTLFDGGVAELHLVESDDPLEAGLEISAQPPGKKSQVMSLLSGGEQALTAISLIFAVFLTNPSPICVLDEVDAPLDDANVERFCDLVDAMRKKTDTRFIAITHNPISMARMDRLFGVTQAERGVSQLVSIDLQEAEHLLDAS